MNVSLKIVDLLGSTLAKSSSEVSNIPFGHQTWLIGWKKHIYNYIYIYTYVHTNTESFNAKSSLKVWDFLPCFITRGDSCPLSPETILKNLEDLGSKLQSYIHPRLIGDLGPGNCSMERLCFPGAPKIPKHHCQPPVSIYSQNFPTYLQSTSNCCFQ